MIFRGGAGSRPASGCLELRVGAASGAKDWRAAARRAGGGGRRGGAFRSAAPRRRDCGVGAGCAPAPRAPGSRRCGAPSVAGLASPLRTQSLSPFPIPTADLAATSRSLGGALLPPCLTGAQGSRPPTGQDTPECWGWGTGHPPFFGQLRELSSLVRLEMGAPRVGKPPATGGRGPDGRNLPHLPAASLRAKLRAESLSICFHPCPSPSSAAPQGIDSLLHLTQSLSPGVGGDMALAKACSLGLPSSVSSLTNSWLSCLPMMNSR